MYATLTPSPDSPRLPAELVDSGKRLKGLIPGAFQTSAMVLAISAALANAGWAQDTTVSNEAGPDSSTVEVIDVFGQTPETGPNSLKFARSMLNTAQTINVIPQSLIEDRAATTLRDVLRNVSGISMQAGEGGTPAGDQMSIRGHSARTDIFVDNIRDFGGYTRDPFNLEQVEVVKGPSSDYSGRGSTGGSINLVSKSAALEDFTSTSLGLGSDQYQRFSLDMNRAIDSLDSTAVRLNLLYHDQDTAGRNEISNKRWGIAPSIGFGLESDTQFRVSLFHLQQDNVPDYGIPWVPATNIPLAEYADGPPPVDFENWYGLKSRDFEDLATSMATAQFDKYFNENVVLQNVTRWGVTDRDSMITAPRFISDDSTDIRRSDEKYRDQEDDILSNQTNLRITFNPGANWEHRLLIGAEVSIESEQRRTQELLGEDSPATDLFNPNPNDPYLENYQRTGTATTADSDSIAVYLSDSIEINEHWQINGGLRWDNFNLKYTPDGSDQLKRTDRMLSYRGGLVYKPVQEGSIYLGYGTSFNPTAEALSISTSSREPGIADLDPEENRTVELGTKWQLLDRQLFVSAAVFRTEKTNARTQDPTDPNDLLVLQGEQLVQGYELGLAGRLFDRLDLTAGYTYLDTKIVESLDASQINNELGNSPKHSFNLWSSYDVSSNFQVGFGAQYVDDRFNSTTNARVAPSYWVYEASASYLVSDQLSLQLNLQNLTDEKYIDYVGGGHFIPGMGRVAMLTSSFRF